MPSVSIGVNWWAVNTVSDGFEDFGKAGEHCSTSFYLRVLRSCCPFHAYQEVSGYILFGTG